MVCMSFVERTDSCGTFERYKRYSMLPFAPVTGLKVSPAGCKSFSVAYCTTFLITSSCTFLSRTIPFLPTCSLPASNCGFTRHTSVPSVPRSFEATGKTSFNYMKDTSMLIKLMGSSIREKSKYLILHFSIFTTRGSIRSL